MQKMLTTKQKLFHFLCIPIIYFLLFNIVYAIPSFIKGDFKITTEWGYQALATAISLTILRWLDLYYPRKDPNKRKKSFKEYLKQYVLKGTRFNRIVLMVYTMCVLLVITIIGLTFAGVL